MKDGKKVPLNRPFEDLKRLLGKRQLPKAPVRPPDRRPEPEDEERLFSEAMHGVIPLPGDQGYPLPPEPQPPVDDKGSVDAESVRSLERLVQEGKGFVVSQTPEYMDGGDPGVAPIMTGRLHRGEYSIQSYMDLHGQGLEEAKESFDAFMKSCTRCGKRAVLIIHGRGLSSPESPVLKNGVREWLCSGRWRKWVMAFSSARMCDGGAGATYVLLRSRPLSRSERKRRNDTPT